MNSVSGFVYVATGTGYLEEARRSAESLRRHNPGCQICLITDNEVVVAPPFDRVIVRHDVQHKPIDKLLAQHCPFDRTVFLDTDTYILDDLTPLFGLLDRFDIAAHQDVKRGWNYELPDVPLSFSEFNTGVIVFRRSPEMDLFFRAWRENYVELQRTHGLINDQPAFRRTLFHSPLRLTPLPSEFHFLGNTPNYVMWNVRLIHARGDYAAIAGHANEHLGGRAYIPDVGVVRSFHGRWDWLKVTLVTAWRMIRLCFHPPADSAAANPRKWWVEEERNLPRKRP